MTLLSMLIALIVERLAVRSRPWQFQSYLQPYLKFSAHGPLAALLHHPYGIFLWWLIPALCVALLQTFIQFWPLNLLMNVLILLICIGCWHYRQLYKQYLNAFERQDQQGAHLVMQQVQSQAGLTVDEFSFGQRWICINFKYYAAVLFWFALFGVFGAIAYAMLRQLSEPLTYQQGEADRVETADLANAPTEEAVMVENAATEGAVNVENAATEPLQPAFGMTDAQMQRVRGFAQDLSHWADWLPVRLFGLGLALVGHFSKASAALIVSLVDTTTSSQTVLADIAHAAEPMPVEALNGPEESSAMVQLGKRNILFFLALIAVLTLSGWL